MAVEREIILITGGTVGGIGFELAANLLSIGKHVLLGLRSEDKRKAASNELRARGLSGTFELLDLDVGDDKSISAAAELVRERYSRLDALVNNAAATSMQSSSSKIIPEQFAQCFRTNATGTYLMGEAFAPLLEKSSGTARMINISSGSGSIRRILDSSSPRYQMHLNMGMTALAYGASKAAQNLITAKQATVYGQKGIKVFAFSPGFVVSNASHMNKVENGAQPTSEAVIPIVRILLGERDGEHGCFLGPEGQYEW